VTVGFVGLSHLGIVYSLATAARGFDVIACEPDVERRRLLSEGRFPIEEPGLAELFAANHERLLYTGDFGRLAACAPTTRIGAISVRCAASWRRPGHSSGPRAAW
jgi:UDPglucose 6-dehydrogenase